MSNIINNRFFFLLIISFPLLNAHIHRQDVPTLEQLINTDKAHICLTYTRDLDPQKVNMDSWTKIAVAVNDLIDKCYAFPDEKSDELFQEIINTLTVAHYESRADKSEGIYEQTYVSGETTKILSPEENQKLIWLGCTIENDGLQEIALVVTDSQLQVLAEINVGPVPLANSLKEIEPQILEFMAPYLEPKPYLCGSDRIGRHRALLKYLMPELESRFSSVTMNCFSVREFCILWHLPVYKRWKANSALEAAYEAIAEEKIL